MIRYITTYSLLFACMNSLGQISVDSLLSNIILTYEETGSKSYLGTNFTTFETADGADRYDIYLDSANQLKEFIGLALVHYTFDAQKRIKLIEGFNSRGFRSYWDFPEVQKFRYINDTLVLEMNEIRNEICDCKYPEMLSTVKVVEEINTNRSYSIFRYTIYSRDSLMKLTFARTSNGDFCTSPDQVTFIFREFDPVTTYLIVHERYYNSKLKLIMGKHKLYTSETIAYSPEEIYAYSTRTFDKGLLKTASYYNKRGKLIKTLQYGDVRGPSTH